MVQHEIISLTHVEDPLPGIRHRRSSRMSSGESARWTNGQRGVADESAEDVDAADDDDDSGPGCGKVNMLRKTVEQLAKIPL